MVAIRREDLSVEMVNDEVLVFNPARGEATALNQSAALVFELCDGTNTVGSMKAALDAAGLAPSSDDAVWLALTELADAGLIELQVPRPEHRGRRELIKQFGAGAAALAALPVVETIKAPSAGAQGSGPAPTTSTTVATPSPTQGVPTTVAPTPSPTQGVPTTVAPTPSPTQGVPTTVAPTPSPTQGVPTTSAPTGAPTGAPTPSPTQGSQR